MSTSKETEIVEEEIVREPAVKLVQNTAEESLPIFKCNQCNYQNKNEKGLVMHERKKDRISQVDGMDDFHEETSTKKIKNYLQKIILKNIVKIPHTGDKASLDRCR